MDGIRASLEGIKKQLRSPEACSLLCDLREYHAVLTPYSSWADLIRDFQASLLPRYIEDDVLKTLISRCHKSRDPVLLAALVGLFSSRLTLIYRRCRSWDRDDGELWSNLQWSFFEVLHRPKLLNRGDRIASKLFNDTRHQLWTVYDRSWSHRRLEVSFDDENDIRQFRHPEGPDRIEILADSALVMRHLNRARTCRVLTDEDYDVLLQVAMGLTAREIAHDRGLDYDLLKKRIQRARHAFRNFHKKSSRQRRFSVPKISARPPSTGEKEDVRNGRITRSLNQGRPMAAIRHLRVSRTTAGRVDATARRGGRLNVVGDAAFGRVASSGRPASTEAARDRVRS